MTEQITVSPRYHTRLLITRNTKGYSYETSCSVDCDDANQAIRELQALMVETDQIARTEIDRRETLDAAGGGE